MTMPLDALTFLETVAGYDQLITKGEQGAAAAPVRLAVIDPAYVLYSYPGTLPKVTFEGEDTLTEKRYAVVGDYAPYPGDRVIMLPVGHTYVIVGTLNTPPFPTFAQHTLDGTADTTSNTSFVSLGGGPIASIVLRQGEYARVTLSCMLFISITGTNGALMSFRVTGASGTIEATDTDGVETGVVDEWVPAEKTTIWGPASVSGSHSFEGRYRAVNTGTANFKFQRIIAEAYGG